ncbi:putative WUSCHEL-related homeobox 11 [Iris pallida]|uniref:WUSCHEL-related homeobox 11 n=1 Tax=Iris pallida TaxID=29817 RepID=A0AAX6HZ21_IRIPA|nr:putative WUSCHEL-related homeobox 11 [Iris pallida]
MDDREKNNEQAAAEPVRSRWTPKPEQIIILENIFNSGTVNPAKDETIRIRKILEQYGSVGDANVFYWFQNRRSRSRRRQRQLQAAAAAAAGFCNQDDPGSSCSSGSNTPSSSNNSSGCGFLSYNTPPSASASASASSSCFVGHVDSSCTDDLFSIPRQMGCMESGQNQFLYSSDAQQLQYQAGTITVFINGIPSEIPRGPFDMRTMFGQDAMLVHSSGELLAVNEYGILLQGLQMGESYFLVSRKG